MAQTGEARKANRQHGAVRGTPQITDGVTSANVTHCNTPSRNAFATAAARSETSSLS